MSGNWWDQGPPPPAIPPIRPPMLGGQMPQGGQGPSLTPGMQDPQATLRAAMSGQRSAQPGQLPPPKVPPMPQTGGMQQAQQGQNYASQMIASNLISQALNQKFFPQQQASTASSTDASTSAQSGTEGVSRQQTPTPGVSLPQWQPNPKKTAGTTSLATQSTDRAALQSYATQVAQKYGIDPDVFARLINQESGWQAGVVSPAGAIGPTQLMPGTAQGLGVDPYDPYQNIEGGARYFADALRQTGSVFGALVVYNSGMGGWLNYQKTGELYPETAAYVKAILG